VVVVVLVTASSGGVVRLKNGGEDRGYGCTWANVNVLFLILMDLNH